MARKHLVKGKPQCEHFRLADCKFRCFGLCEILEDTDFGKRDCPFYKKLMPGEKSLEDEWREKEARKRGHK